MTVGMCACIKCITNFTNMHVYNVCLSYIADSAHHECQPQHNEKILVAHSKFTPD